MLRPSVLVGVLTIAFTCIGAAPAAPPPSPAPPPAAIDIYSNAIREMRSLAAKGAPPYLVFDLHIDSHNLHWYPDITNGVSSWDAKLVHANETDDYRVWYRTKDQRALVQDANTHASYRGDTPFAPDPSGLSDLSKPVPSPSPTATTNGTASGSAQVIGAVTVNASRDYDIQLLGIEDRAGVQVYHLHLHAKRDPTDNPLTDMWVDTADYRVWAVHGEVTIRAIAAGFGLGIDAAWAPVAGDWLVSSVDFSGKGYIMLWHLNIASAMTTHVVSVPASLPESYFGK